MTSSPLVLPGVLFVGEDDRTRLVALMGPAAGWFTPRGILGWSHEVSVVVREALTEEIRRTTKAVMPEEQIPPAKNPLTLQAALKSPLVAVASKLVPKLVEAGVRVHTVGVDRVTSSFYYLAEGGDEEPARIEGDLVAAVGAMLGERADNAAIERVLDGLVDRLLRALSRDRVSELSIELAASLPRAAADGTGMQDVDLDAFEKELAKLVAASEKYTALAQEIADKIAGTYERRVEVPLFGEARKSSQGPFDLMVGDQKVSLPTYERWLMAHALTEPGKAAPASAKAPTSTPKPATPKPAPASATTKAAPVAPPRPASNPPPRPEAKPDPGKPRAPEDVLANLERVSEPQIPAAKAAPSAAKTPAAKPAPSVGKTPAAAPVKAEEKKADEKVEAKAEEKKAEEKKAEEKVEAKAEEKKAEEKVEAKAEEKKADEKKADEKKADEKKADEKKADEKKADEKKAEAKADEKKAAKKKTDEPAKTPAKGEALAKAEPKKSSFTWVALLVALVAAAVAYRMWFQR